MDYADNKLMLRLGGQDDIHNWFNLSINRPNIISKSNK